MLTLLLSAMLAFAGQESAPPLQPVKKPVMKAPRVLYAPEPQPLCAVPHGVYIHVTILLVVTAEGRPGQMEVLRSGGVACLDESALKTAAKYRFSPATEDGVKVATKLRIEISFSQS